MINIKIRNKKNLLRLYLCFVFSFFHQYQFFHSFIFSFIFFHSPVLPSASISFFSFLINLSSEVRNFLSFAEFPWWKQYFFIFFINIFFLFCEDPVFFLSSFKSSRIDLQTSCFPSVSIMPPLHQHAFQKWYHLHTSTFGQECVLQDLESLEDPEQEAPPYAGLGLLQERYFLCVPPPQSLLQEP